MKTRKPTTKRRVTKRRTPVKKTPPIIAPSVPPVPESSAVPTGTVHSLYQPVDPTTKIKVWLGVAIAMAVILGVWTWSLQYTLFNLGNQTATSNSSDLSELVSNIKDNLSALQQQTNTVVNTAPATTPQQQQLKDLFSDMQ